MVFNLIKARVISFAYGLVTLVVGSLFVAILGAVSGPEFHALVVANFGDGVVSSFIFLIVTQIVSHVRNVAVVGAYREKLGAAREASETPDRPVLI